MDRDTLGFWIAIIGTTIIFSGSITGIFSQEIEVKKGYLLDPITGKYTERYYEHEYTPEPLSTILLSLIIIGFIMLPVGTGLIYYG